MFRCACVGSAVALAVSLLYPMPVRSCAIAPGDGTSVSVAEESAVIVWDAATHTEHFVRRAEFEAQGKDFGFLVPTPSLPTLAQASDGAFTDLERLMEPKVTTRVLTGYTFTGWLFPPSTTGSMPMTASAVAPTATKSVEMFSSQKIGRYDAVVLKANDIAALSRWLKGHGYAARPALMAWLAPYVTRHWFITAFKIAQHKSGEPVISSAAVRMSFRTEKPFFPYSEPADQRQEGRYYRNRLLRVFLLDTQRMAGTMGAGANGKPWVGRVAWTDAVAGIDRNALARRLALSPEQLPGSLWMTVFEDASSPRQGTADLYFYHSPIQSPILTPPVTVVQDRRVSVPLEPIILALLVMTIGIARIAAQRRGADPDTGSA